MHYLFPQNSINVFGHDNADLPSRSPDLDDVDLLLFVVGLDVSNTYAEALVN